MTDIVCNVRHRAALESYCPTFGKCVKKANMRQLCIHSLTFLTLVRLVREYYGFDDEDEAEIARVKGVSSLHSNGKTIFRLLLLHIKP